MPQTLEAGWRHRTRTPVLVATACAWLATVEVSAWQPGMESMRGATSASDHASLVLAGLMVASMMAPLLIEPLRHGLARSLRRRRARAVCLLVVTHLAVWLAGGIALLFVASWLLDLVGLPQALTAGAVTALAWHVSPASQRLANRHHARPPLSAFGSAADTDLVSYGVLQALSCLGACWPVMLLPALSSAHQLSVMAVGSVWIWTMALEAPTPPRWRFPWPSRAWRLSLGSLSRLGRHADDAAGSLLRSPG